MLELPETAVAAPPRVGTTPTSVTDPAAWGDSFRAADPWYQTLSVLLCAACLVVVDVIARNGLSSASAAANATAAVATVASFPLAAFAMYTRLALGLRPMLLQVTALVITTYALPSLLPALPIQTLASCLVGGLVVAASTRRGTVVTAGIWAGLVSAVVFLIAGQQQFASTTLVAGAAGSIMGGALSGAFVLTLSPLAERLFRHVTTLTLLESLSYDHPLLRQLMTTAPGTFLHSSNLAVLCDTAAHAVGVDALTLRAAALYHDIGKTRAPEFFIENQDGVNLLADLSPSEAADVLRAHVRDGVQLVNRHGLGPRLAPFVREHHGTSVMRSLQDRAGSTVDPDVFQYPGPRPQSRETGLLMIADQVEATARSLQPGTLAECRELVQDAVTRIVGEDQLRDSGLTRANLEAVTTALADVIHAIHHRRVRYPSDPHRRPHAVEEPQS
jgi:putative nucleotidyltransferase with HDIG domain